MQLWSLKIALCPGANRREMLTSLKVALKIAVRGQLRGGSIRVTRSSAC